MLNKRLCLESIMRWTTPHDQQCFPNAGQSAGLQACSQQSSPTAGRCGRSLVTGTRGGERSPLANRPSFVLSAQVGAWWPGLVFPAAAPPRLKAQSAGGDSAGPWATDTTNGNGARASRTCRRN
ncbi:hypothetical protein VFPFJ_01777 [Purpureocillium lilacinum]|uniref:Uncharacterized protein n=1 Tax=Purpureocillium lilacinum TaxID=33203 RepID=A0A179HQ95_PURLI|nr:hypothetical protein VFPFJ_01777 [Purpureocillium lilacinum]OAQ92616.1 hypothetical protein VFPFJ_01777 [Purpureocillium lilacinum]